MANNLGGDNIFKSIVNDIEPQIQILNPDIEILYHNKKCRKEFGITLADTKKGGINFLDIIKSSCFLVTHLVI
jgi:hypothetical protein